MTKKKYQTRLPANVADEVDEFQDEHDLSQAEAVRQLIVRGVDSNPDGEDGITLWQKITGIVQSGDRS